MKIGIVGCAGRMGRTLIEETQTNDQSELSGGCVRSSSKLIDVDLGVIAGIEPIGINASSNIEALFEISDAVIDFSTPNTSIYCADLAAKHKTVHVIGTTGFSNTQFDDLKTHAKRTPIIWSANMSIGINILQTLTEKIASLLDESYNIEIVEMHHHQKVDAPSGTALALGEAAAKGRNVNLDDVAQKSRDGIIGARDSSKIGFSTIRGGDVVGEHTVMFAGDGERIELTHKASSRKIFAKGAVRAALWANGIKPGLYNMKDVLQVS